MKQIFFLILLISTSLITVQQVYATHYTEYGLDDVFYWREHKNAPDLDSNCWFAGQLTLPEDPTGISWKCDSDSDTQGTLYIMKHFERDLIYNNTSDSVFTFNLEHQMDEVSARGVQLTVMDGLWTHSSQATIGGFPSNIDWNQDGGQCDGGYTTYTNYGWHNVTGWPLCIDNDDSPNEDDFIYSGSTGSLFDSNIGKFSAGLDPNKGEITQTLTITNAMWTTATEDYITVILIFLDQGGVGTDHYIQPNYFRVTNTDHGTLTWDFPTTDEEVTLWETYGGEGVYQLNGTDNDYGYIFTLDPGVPDPPTNLIAVVDSADIDLSWTAPIFEGYSPIIGYKIERESPIGGGFTTLVANTGSLATTYEDSTITPGQEYNYRVRALNSYGESLPSNESKDGIPGTSVEDPTPDVNCDGDPDIFSLIVAAVTQTTATLCWNGDILQPINRTGFQVNFTTPWGEPLNIVNGLNNTGSNATTRLIENLSPGTQYSFRVHSWFNGSSDYNMTNIANTTTLPGGLDIGDLVFDTSPNTDIFGYDFVRAGPCWDGFTTLGLVCPNGTATYLYVNYPQTYNTTCNFEMKFARTNQTFSNLSTQESGGVDRVFANFTFTDLKNEVVTVDCWDEDSDATGRYLLTQTSFPLLTQMDQFRDGTFGTQGEFGAFDMITLIVVIVSMIGFNRVHTAVGAVFSMIIVGVAAFFGIIQWYSALFGIIAVVTMVAIVSNRKGGE